MYVKKVSISNRTIMKCPSQIKKNTPRKIYSDSFHGISLAIKLKIISNVDTKNNTGWFSCHLELWKLKRIKIRISF